MTKLDDNQCWRAVRDRDGTKRGEFYYGVRTTGIFCDPGCGSKTPLRENVEFFSSKEAAISAGYRPCKRCRSDMPDVGSNLQQKVVQACQTIMHTKGRVKLDDLAAKAGLSSSHFHRLFKSVTGITPKQYGMSYQSRLFKDRLRDADSITDAIYEAGFSSSSRAYENAQNFIAMELKQFRAGAPGKTILYGMSRCSLGFVIVGMTERGICGVEFGDSRSQLLKQFQQTFPRAELVEADSHFNRVMEDVVEYVENPMIDVDLPLDIQGTAFQLRVWDALRGIKAGTTIHYGQLAEKIGNPKAVRAAAKACASNKLAVLIPCHRVVYKDGRISGYRWGVARKRKLLKQEADAQVAERA